MLSTTTRMAASKQTPHQVHLTVHLRTPHPKQIEFIRSPAKRKVIRAGRRAGKTVGVATLALERFLAGQRILYATPTQEQVDAFWEECRRALAEPIAAKALYKNETLHVISQPGTERRIRAKTAWNADTLRGDYAHLLILDEYQQMNEDAWERVGAPMLLDNDGDAVFIYTPPSIRSLARSKAVNPRHAAKMFQRAQQDQTGRWAAFHFPSHANPHISRAALDDIVSDMTALAYRQEILAEDLEDNPGALWKRADIEAARLLAAPADLALIAVAVDPSATAGGDECGIVVGGMDRQRPPHAYIMGDESLQASPDGWAKQVLLAKARHGADMLIYEANQGGEMVEAVIRSAAKAHAEVGAVGKIEAVHATRGKRVRAEPIAAFYEQGRVHHIGTFPHLEDELCMWSPADSVSPNRLDALVWLVTRLLGRPQGVFLA